jgi:hypothetical protein
MDFLRYVTGLAVFLSASLVLSFSVHLLLMRHTKRKHAALSSQEQ